MKGRESHKHHWKFPDEAFRGSLPTKEEEEVSAPVSFYCVHGWTGQRMSLAAELIEALSVGQRHSGETEESLGQGWRRRL